MKRRIYEALLSGAILTCCNIGFVSSAYAYSFVGEYGGPLFDLEGVDFNTDERYKDLDLKNGTFRMVNLTDASFAGKDLSGSTFTSVIFYNTDFEGATINNTSFDGANITREQLVSTQSYRDKDLSGIKISGTGFSKDGMLTFLNFSRVDFSGVNFANSSFEYASFIGSDFKNANFSGTKFNAVDFRGAQNLTLADAGTGNYIWTDGTIMSNGQAGMSIGHIYVAKNDFDNTAARFTADSKVSQLFMENGGLVTVDRGVSVELGFL